MFCLLVGSSTEEKQVEGKHETGSMKLRKEGKKPFTAMVSLVVVLKSGLQHSDESSCQFIILNIINSRYMLVVLRMPETFI